MLLFKPHPHNMSFDHGSPHLKHHPNTAKYHSQLDADNGETQNSHLAQAINKQLVYIDHVGYVPNSADGMAAFIKAKPHFHSTGEWQGLKGMQATNQYMVDELKMFKNVNDAQAHSIVEQLGL